MVKCSTQCLILVVYIIHFFVSEYEGFGTSFTAMCCCDIVCPYPRLNCQPHAIRQALAFGLLVVGYSQSLEIAYELLQSNPDIYLGPLATPAPRKFLSVFTTFAYSLLAPPRSLEGSNSLPAWTPMEWWFLWDIVLLTRLLLVYENYYISLVCARWRKHALHVFDRQFLGVLVTKGPDKLKV